MLPRTEFDGEQSKIIGNEKRTGQDMTVGGSYWSDSGCHENASRTSRVGTLVGVFTRRVS